MIILIDNYDSFVHNLGRYFERLGRKQHVVRNDAITLHEIGILAPEAIILSPGPCTPKKAGISLKLIEKFHDSIPILGVCLGHQCIGEAFGGETVRAARPVHGKASIIQNLGDGVFSGLPRSFRAARYHSLAVSLPAGTPLKICARTDDGTIMALQHERYPVFGLQFHPESVLSEHGLDILKNFMSIADTWSVENKRKAA